MKGRLFGVGVGPGDPELMTYKAVRIIRNAKCSQCLREAGNMRSATGLQRR